MLIGLSHQATVVVGSHSCFASAYFADFFSQAAFGGLFFLSLYLAGKLHLYDQRGEVWKVFICIVPTLGAGLVAVSRIEDARHHPFDVIFGSLLGTLCAWGSYRQYFPSLGEAWKKGRAYPMRSWGTEPSMPTEQQVEREFARDRGKEALRARTLPQSSRDDVYGEADTEGEGYDTLHSQRKYQSSNPIQKRKQNQISNPRLNIHNHNQSILEPNRSDPFDDGSSTDRLSAEQDYRQARNQALTGGGSSNIHGPATGGTRDSHWRNDGFQDEVEFERLPPAVGPRDMTRRKDSDDTPVVVVSRQA